ncbi:antibiotic biosynthesis monooxygenase [Mycolicibacterium cosmeticum]|uniref:antibiotic biosynthesis monooxygenase n=1 Tax=Mycolicibacterium cosmeticum TaxID=258533 RepID=UPI0032046FB8
MTTLSFLVTLQARPGREADVAAVLREANKLVGAEPGAHVWFGFHYGGTTFGILDAFDTDSEPHARLHSRVRTAVEAHAELFATPPVITIVDGLDAPLPRGPV